MPGSRVRVPPLLLVGQRLRSLDSDGHHLPGTRAGTSFLPVSNRWIAQLRLDSRARLLISAARSPARDGRNLPSPAAVPTIECNIFRETTSIRARAGGRG